MTWSIAALYGQNKPALRELLAGHPLLGGALHRLRGEAGGGRRGRSSPLPREGLLAIPGFGPPDHDRIAVEVPWDALIGPPLRLTFPGPETLAEHGLSPRNWPPAATLRGLKDLSLRSRSPVILYVCEMWGGDIDVEVAWVPGWVSGEPDRALWYHEGGSQQATAGARPRPLGRDVLGAALEYLRVRLPGAYFEPHTRSFAWARYRLGAAPPEGAEGGPPPPHPGSLYRCVQHGDLAGTLRLLEAGADPNAYGWTRPLEVAAELGRADLVAALLAQGADPAPKEHLTALHAAADMACVDLLLAAGVPVDGDPRYYSPLARAASQGRDAVARRLLERGAALQPARYPLSVWFAACEGGLVWILEELLARGVDPDACRDQGGPSGLEIAAGEGQREAAEALVRAGATMNERTFVACCSGGLAALVRAHLRRGIAATASRYGQSALVSAIRGAHTEVAAILLEAGADADARFHGWTTLHLAAETGEPALIELLLGRVGDPEAALAARDPLGWTPLFTAARRGQRAIVEALIRGGAAIDVVDDSDRRSIEVARARGLDLEAIAAALQGEGAPKPEGDA